MPKVNHPKVCLTASWVSRSMASVHITKLPAPTLRCIPPPTGEPTVLPHQYFSLFKFLSVLQCGHIPYEHEFSRNHLTK